MSVDRSILGRWVGSVNTRRLHEVLDLQCVCNRPISQIPQRICSISSEWVSKWASEWVSERVRLTAFLRHPSPYCMNCKVTINFKKTRTIRTPAFWGYPTPPHDYPYHWAILDPKSKEDKVKVTNLKKSPKFQIFEFWNGHYTRHTFWSCLIRCANMKWIRWVFLKIQSGHDSVHRRTDGRLRRIWSQLPWSKLHRILASSFLSSSYRVIFVFFI